MFSTHITLKETLTRVCPFVASEFPFISKASTTVLTNIWFFPCMGSSLF